MYKTFKPWPIPTSTNISKVTDSIDMSCTKKASKKARTQDETASHLYYKKHLTKCYHADGDKNLMRYAIKQIKNAGPVFEFGTYEAYSTNYIAKQLPKRTVYGFDLFDPNISFQDDEDWNGHDFTQTKLPRVKSNVILIKGLFANTLPGFSNVTPALIHIDCDNYAGAKSVFDSVNIVKNTIIVFDEYLNVPNWTKNEYLAFHQYCLLNNVKYKYIAVNTTHQQVAIQII